MSDYRVDPYNPEGPFRIFYGDRLDALALCEDRDDADLIAAALNAQASPGPSSPADQPATEDDLVACTRHNMWHRRGWNDCPAPSSPADPEEPQRKAHLNEHSRDR